MLWYRLLGAIRDPAQSATVNGLVATQILGSFVVCVRDDGQFDVALWTRDRSGRITLSNVAPACVVVQGMPWRRLWLRNLEPLAGLQVQRWHEYHGGAPFLEMCDQYAAWAFGIFSKRLSSHCDLRLMRRRVADALGLDAWTLKMAARIPRPHTRENITSISDYNLIVRHRADFKLLDAEAPSLIPLFAACCEVNGFPSGRQPVARLKAHLRANGVSERGWRLVAQSNGRLLLPLRRFYRGPVPHTAVEHLRLLDALELRRQPPCWFVNQLLATWGDPGNRSESYVNDIERAKSLWCHVARVLPTDATAQHQTRDEFDLIRRWIDRSGHGRQLEKGQRRMGWVWLLRSARAWGEARLRTADLARDTWPVPLATAAVGQWRFVALGNALALWHEARAMHHCADTFGSSCRTGTSVIVSVQRNGRRVATAQISPVDGAWQLQQVKGPANRSVDEHVVAAVRVYIQQLPAPLRPMPERVQEPLDANGGTVKERIEHPECDAMGGARFERLLAEALDRIRIRNGAPPWNRRER
jgi:hypothetical protein